MIDDRELFKRLRRLRRLSWDALALEVGRPKGSLSGWASGTKGTGVERDALAWISRQPAALIQQARAMRARPKRQWCGFMQPARDTAPIDRSMLEPVLATAEDARDWLYQEWQRRGLAHDAIEARIGALTDTGALREANLLRVQHGLPPYLPPRTAPQRPFA